MVQPILSSDVLEAQLGPTQIEVLKQSEAERIICTRVVETGQRLELSRVIFDPLGAKHFEHVHRQILEGQSMGKAFREADIAFSRREVSAQRVSLRPSLLEWFQADGPATVVNVAIYLGDKSTHYADIFEIYSPVVKWPSATAISDRQPDQSDAAIIHSLVQIENEIN
jgi:hypothetical protein